MSLLPLILLATGVFCHQEEEQVVNVVLQRDALSAVTCPLKPTEPITWTELQGGQRGVPWEGHLIFTTAQGPESQLYRCHSGNLSALVNVTVRDTPFNTAEGTIENCQHGKPCALICSSENDAAAEWPGVATAKALWWGKEWTDVHIKVRSKPGCVLRLLLHCEMIKTNFILIQGEDPMLISPGVIISDYVRNPSLLGCKTLYRVTEMGHNATGLPLGHKLYGRETTMAMSTILPYSQIVRPTCRDLMKTVAVPVTLGQRLEIECEGIAWDIFDVVYWLKKPCRGQCDTEFVLKEGRVSEQAMNTTLVNNLFGDPVSMKLVFTSVEESDLASTFYCKLQSSGKGDLVTVYLKDRNAAPRSRTANAHYRG